jgi:hypothetical protein
LLVNAALWLRHSDHVIAHREEFYEKACAISVDGIVSKRIEGRRSGRHRHYPGR